MLGVRAPPLSRRANDDDITTIRDANHARLCGTKHDRSGRLRAGRYEGRSLRTAIVGSHAFSACDSRPAHEIRVTRIQGMGFRWRRRGAATSSAAKPEKTIQPATFAQDPPMRIISNDDAGLRLLDLLEHTARETEIDPLTGRLHIGDSG